MADTEDRIAEAYEQGLEDGYAGVAPEAKRSPRKHHDQIQARLQIAAEQIRRALELDSSLHRAPHSLLDVEYAIRRVHEALWNEKDGSDG
ncbi:MAG: hypothetical protein P4L67_04320 [Candidatus Pacebacteria bacterium]|nr:hypothetical protein [Candidatus Paceibacterota bacterium]